MSNIGMDKYIHAGICFGITFVLIVIFYALGDTYLRSSLAGVMASIGAALGKEYGDKVNPYNNWDWYDIYADISGIVGGLFLGSLLWI